MRCPKCGYNSFDHLDSCKKCGKELEEHKQRYGIKSVLFPGQMKPAQAAEADSDLDSFVVDAAVAAATATSTAVVSSAGAAEDGVADPVAAAGSSESDDFGFDFMGESDEEEDLSFDELFEEAPADEDVEETLTGPEAEPEAAAEEVAEFSFDSAVEDEVSEKLPSEAELDNDFGFDLDDPSTPVNGEGPVADLAADDFELPAVAADDFDFSTDEIEFEETDEKSGPAEDPKPPFELPESPQHEVAPEQDQDFFVAPPRATPEAALELSLDQTELLPLAAAAEPQTTVELIESPGEEGFATDSVMSSPDPFAEDDELFTAAEIEPVADSVASTDAEMGIAASVEPERSVDPFAEDDELLSVAVDRSAGQKPAVAVEPIAEPVTAVATAIPAPGAATVIAAASAPVDAAETCHAADPDVSSRTQLAPSFGSRFAAFSCDLFILTVVAGSFIVAAETAMSGSDEHLLPSVATLINLSVPYFLVLFSLAFGYFTLFHFLVGQTPGKMLARLRVETLDGEPLVLSQAFLRSVGGLLQLLPVGLGYLAALLNSDRRGWNDRLAGTRLISLKG